MVKIESQATVTITWLTNGCVELRSNGTGTAGKQADALLQLAMSITKNALGKDYEVRFRDGPKD